MATPEAGADVTQCKENSYISLDDAQAIADQIDPYYQCSMLNFCDETLLASAKMKMMWTRDLEDDDMCGSCIEMFEDMKTLVTSDEGVQNIIAVGDMVCNPEYC